MQPCPTRSALSPSLSPTPPWTTSTIVAANALAWAFVQGFGGEPELVRSVCTHGLIAGELLQTAAPGAHFALGPDASCVVSDVSHPLTLLTQEIADHFLFGKQVAGATLISPVTRILYLPDHLQSLRQFTSVVTLTFRGWRKAA